MFQKMTLSILFLVFSLGSTCQVLEVINAVGGALLPQVVDGIKRIKESGNNNNVKVDRDIFNKSVGDIRDYIKGITTAVERDSKNIDALLRITSSSTLLYDDLGALESFSSGPLLDAILASNNEPAIRRVSIAISTSLDQFRTDIDKMVNEVDLYKDISQDLKDQIVLKLRAIKQDNTKLNSTIQASGVSKPSDASSYDELRRYLNKAKEMNSEVVRINRLVGDLQSTLLSRLGTSVTESGKLGAKIDSKFSEITK